MDALYSETNYFTFKNKKMKQLFRAWSNDWRKSYTFDGKILNSTAWNAFTKKMDRILGHDWGYELALTEKINTDIN